jgi:hypothetical protein
MSYADCISRISQLDSLIRGVDPNWATSGRSLVATEALISGSPFAGVLETISAKSASTGSTATAAGSVLASVASLAFTSPLPSGRLTQAFGPTDETLEPSATVNGVTYAHYHNGIDIGAPLGSSVYAAASGTVIMAGPQSDGAIVVKIQHDDGHVTLYGHLDPSLPVVVGQRVNGGQMIGKVGMTGVTTGPHLHFGLYTSGGTAVDPAPWLAAGHLPDPPTLMGPNPADPHAMAQVSGSVALARFDAASSRIPYAAQIRSAAVANGIDPSLLAALVSAESNFHPDAVSSCGAQGLCQLMPGTAAGLGVTDSFNVQQNLDGGAKYIARQLQNFGRVDMALAAYNAGPGYVSRLGSVPNACLSYIGRILDKWVSYQEPSA